MNTTALGGNEQKFHMIDRGEKASAVELVFNSLEYAHLDDPKKLLPFLPLSFWYNGKNAASIPHSGFMWGIITSKMTKYILK